jgi:hypothetical protein
MNWYKKAQLIRYQEPAVSKKWYHFTFSPEGIKSFDIFKRRNAVYFSPTPEGALEGAFAGFRDKFPIDMMKNPTKEDVKNGWMIEVSLDPSIKIYHDESPRFLSPEEYDRLLDYAEKIQHENTRIEDKMKRLVRDQITGRPGTTVFDDQNKDIGIEYRKLPHIPDWEGFEYEGVTIDALKNLGYDGSYVVDESGLALAIFSPDKVNIVKQYKL